MDIEIKFKAGDSLQIPEGCKAIVKDNVVVFGKEEKEEVQEFKDGDVLHSIHDDTMLIFKSYDRNAFSSHYDSNDEEISFWRIDAFRHATEDEKQLLFDKMKEQGLRWNTEEKKVEKIRWRAGVDEKYFTITIYGQIINFYERNCEYDDTHYDAYAYFRTGEEAEEAAKRVKETLRNYHEEIGE